MTCEKWEVCFDHTQNELACYLFGAMRLYVKLFEVLLKGAIDLDFKPSPFRRSLLRFFTWWKTCVNVIEPITCFCLLAAVKPLKDQTICFPLNIQWWGPALNHRSEAACSVYLCCVSCTLYKQLRGFTLHQGFIRPAVQSCIGSLNAARGSSACQTEIRGRHVSAQLQLK